MLKMLHIRYNGRSFDMDARILEVHAGMTDAQIKAIVARHLEIEARNLNGYIVDRARNGNLVVRPEAVYG